jgi:hypothetical protein
VIANIVGVEADLDAVLDTSIQCRRLHCWIAGSIGLPHQQVVEASIQDPQKVAFYLAGEDFLTY